MPTSSDPVDPILRDRAQSWIARLIAGDMTEAELDELDAWIAADPAHARAFARERALWQDLGELADVLTAPAKPQKSVLRSTPVRRMVPIALAASILAVIMRPSLLLSLRADHRTAHGEVRSLQLSDGTTAALDSDSAIAVDYADGRRVVRLLSGRVWFHVRHEQRPFLVDALGGVTQDIGTSFEVSRQDGSAEVAVTEGAVQVQSPLGEHPALLRAGGRVRYSATGLQHLAGHAPASMAAWRNGELLLEGKPVADAIAEVGRYRHAPVWTWGDFGDVPPVSGLFLIERPDEALETIARMRGLDLVSLPGGMLIIRPRHAR